MSKTHATAGTFGILLGFLAGIGLIIASPLILIWALNLLFDLGIAYSFLSWLAMTIVLVIVTGSPLVKCRRR